MRDIINKKVKTQIIKNNILNKMKKIKKYNLKRDDHPLKSLLPRYKDCIVNLRRKSIVRPSINTERFKDSFFNRLIFKYNLAV